MCILRLRMHVLCKHVELHLRRIRSHDSDLSNIELVGRKHFNENAGMEYVRRYGLRGSLNSIISVGNANYLCNAIAC